MEKLCNELGHKVVILRDPPRDENTDEAGDMSLFDTAKVRVLIASYGCYLIPTFESKGSAEFYYAHP